MRFSSSTALLITTTVAALTVAACNGDDDHGSSIEELDAEGCEHLTQGPYQPIEATAVRGEAPWVAPNHMAYTVTLPPAVPSYVLFDATEDTFLYLFLDQSVPVKVFTSAGAEVALHETGTAVATCPAINGRHVVELEVGVHFIELGTLDGVTSTNLVFEAGEHDH